MYGIRQIRLVLGKDGRVATVLLLDSRSDASLVQHLATDHISGRQRWIS